MKGTRGRRGRWDDGRRLRYQLVGESENGAGGEAEVEARAAAEARANTGTSTAWLLHTPVGIDEEGKIVMNEGGSGGGDEIVGWVCYADLEVWPCTWVRGITRMKSVE